MLFFVLTKRKTKFDHCTNGENNKKAISEKVLLINNWFLMMLGRKRLLPAISSPSIK
jgi:hypothetical protein